jgi:hypothetical protein
MPQSAFVSSTRSTIKAASLGKPTLIVSNFIISPEPE